LKYSKFQSSINIIIIIIIIIISHCRNAQSGTLPVSAVIHIPHRGSLIGRLNVVLSQAAGDVGLAASTLIS